MAVANNCGRLGAALLLLAPALAAAHECNGYDEEWGECPDLKPCHTCSPVNTVDCKWENWGSWYEGGGCTGLLFRHRGIEAMNNKCGHPCNGTKIESKSKEVKECQLEIQDCRLSGWTEWSTCETSTSQRYRTREILTHPLNGGKACANHTEETAPCSGPAPVHCELDDWNDWTSCSATCGVGRHTRMRKVKSEAKHGGSPCEGETLQAQPCEADVSCPSKDCKMADWEDWSMCDAAFHPQRYRQRGVLQHSVGDGEECPPELKQTTGCPAPAAVDCELSEWSSWATCDRTCGGGQTYRSRYLKKPMSNNGQCTEASLREAAACNVPPCAQLPEDCEVGTWSEWSECSAKCGQGSMSRKRKVMKLADDGGQGCTESLEELKPCTSAACDVTDCRWGEWYDWSGCSKSCGGGVKRRTRVVEDPPRNGGAPCETKHKEEAVPCHTFACECVDGEWDEWLEWSACSATCSTGFRSRNRVVKREPNECGKALSGLRTEFEACEQAACIKAVDCSLSDWTEWSACNSTCYGIRERNRVIQISAQGAGKPCETSAMKQMGSCHPATGVPATGPCALPVQDASLSQWTEWSECTKSCGGGQMTRNRRLLTKPENGGKVTEDTLAVTAPCNTQRCGPVEQCMDCTWGEWGEWSQCTKCEGQRERHRSIVQMPNHCGKQCSLASAKEVSNCTGQCEEQLFCAWTKWSEPTGCNAGCGLSTTMRNRALGLSRFKEGSLFEGSGTARCSGVQMKVETCANARSCKEECVPQNGQFTAWSEWTSPTCVGLCERERNIAVVSNECGTPAQGPLVETKSCEAACEKALPCLLSAWDAWSECADPSGQSFRNRKILQMPLHNGAPCEGSLHETKACSQPCAERPCLLAEWSEWGACARPCDGGWQTRNRRILEHAKCGGEACNENLEEMRVCNEQACATNKVDCEFADWNPWSGCGTDNQRYRERSVATQADGGAACDGPLLQTKTCAQTLAADCVFSEWSSWTTCDISSCGWGQKHRHRQIESFGAGCGRGGNESLMQTQGCQVQCDAEDCLLGDWSQWDSCSASCGVGQQRRSRKVLRQRGESGSGCRAPLSEAVPCAGSTPCEQTDCEWGEWSPWSSCSCTCGGGQRSRDRHIKTAPRHGGKACPSGPDEHREVIEPCNTQACKEPECLDGTWSEWSEWSPCSDSCGGGVQHRMRKVATMANECGNSPEGGDREEKMCNADVSCEPAVDCSFSDWGSWSDCSNSCDGIMRRSRRIATYGRGTGKFCEGGLKETAPCETAAPGSCELEPSVDCLFAQWESWGACSAKCGGGHQARERKLLIGPLRGGSPCDGGLSEVQECNRESCERDAVDCVLGEWQEWSACDRCGGQRKRFREIVQHAEFGGHNCDLKATEEIGKCQSTCHDVTYCTWASWKEWGACTAQCGEGRRSRRRYLAVEAKEPQSIFDLEGSLSAEFEELKQRRQHLESGQLHGPVLAFVGGCACFLLAFAVVRLSASTSRRRLLLRGREPLQANSPYGRLPYVE